MSVIQSSLVPNVPVGNAAMSCESNEVCIPKLEHRNKEKELYAI